MVQYADIPERQRWIFGYYLILCLAGFSMVLGSPGPAIPIVLGDTMSGDSCLASPGMGGGGIGNCGNGANCHSAEVNAWSTTGHATHIVEINATHVRIGGDINVSYVVFDAECAACHTSGYNDVTGSYDAIGVDCRACHDSSWPEWSDYSGALCSSCHNPKAPEGPHPHLEWRNTAHANSLSDLRASDLPSSECMYCHSTEAFVYYRNPDFISIQSPAVNTSFPVNGAYSTITCPACHSVHTNWSSSPAMIRAENSTELCRICHSGPDQPMYDIWMGSSHQLAGVECVDCHGYYVQSDGHGFMNHTFNVNSQEVCGQSEFCHEGMETYVLGQLEIIHDTYEALTLEILSLADTVENQAAEYEASQDANATVISIAHSTITEARNVVESFNEDRSRGLHDWREMSDSLNAVHRALLQARAAIFEAESIVHDLISGEIDVTTHTMTVTRHIDPPPAPLGQSELNFVGGAVGGFMAALIIGIIVGRKYFYE
ncbi:MAG: ammonia-forming cytochrome c nitrite reductase subunit c552 [Candidatus Thorarchaeota archaeon]